MIKLVEKKKPVGKTNEPYYKLIYYYMIGDADGETQETVQLTINNPFIEKFCSLLEKIEPRKGYYGISLDEGIVDSNVAAGNITFEEGKFLEMCLFNGPEDEMQEILGDDFIFAYQFSEGVRNETEYSYLSFEGYDLFYIDEYGETHDTYFE